MTDNQVVLPNDNQVVLLHGQTQPIGHSPGTLDLYKDISFQQGLAVADLFLVGFHSDFSSNWAFLVALFDIFRTSDSEL